jgi:hypothetical protein
MPMEDTVIWSWLFYCTTVTSVFFLNKVANFELSNDKYIYGKVYLISNHHVFGLSHPHIPDGGQ